LKWQILDENKVVREGEVNVVKGLPRKNLEVNLPFAFESYIDGNYAFRFGLVLKESTVWADKGYEIAWEEFAFKSTDQGRYLVKKEGF
jgi:beta-galactosidase